MESCVYWFVFYFVDIFFGVRVSEFILIIKGIVFGIIGFVYFLW